MGIIPLTNPLILSHKPKISRVRVQIGNVHNNDRRTPSRSISGPLNRTPQQPSMVDPMYIMLNIFLDSPVVFRMGSVNAQKPMDCPGSAKIITVHDIKNAKYRENESAQ